MTYLTNNKRLTFDAPSSLHEEIHASIPPGLFSHISRMLFREFVRLSKKNGVQTIISAAFDNRLRLIYIAEIEEKERKEKRNGP